MSIIFPSSVVSFFTVRGKEPLLSADPPDLAAIVRVFGEARPGPDSDPLSDENLVFLSAAADCIGAMDERIYEHYRALIDLFRAGVFRAPRERLLSSPAWTGLLQKGVRMGLLPEELYGESRPRPHIGARVQDDQGKGDRG